MSEKYQDPFTRPFDECPECGETITGITFDELRDCTDHLTHEELKEVYLVRKKEVIELRERNQKAQNEIYRLKELILVYTDRLERQIEEYKEI